MFIYTNFPIYAGSSASCITHQHTFTDSMHYRIFSSWMITSLWWWKTTFKCKCVSMKVNQECNSFSCNLTVSKPTPVLISPQRFAPVHHQPPPAQHHSSQKSNKELNWNQNIKHKSFFPSSSLETKEVFNHITCTQRQGQSRISYIC